MKKVKRRRTTMKKAKRRMMARKKMRTMTTASSSHWRERESLTSLNPQRGRFLQPIGSTAVLPNPGGGGRGGEGGYPV